ncbi:carbonic anhydrase [Noviherbaspirillum aerium]|uniref:carbonic anhydrase n=1 Tax=Noviherbaspirillum aerium TaxID=2588497 RepID=UPI00124CB308|nr:carbonic anhydrase [Noviherbaspirillum aerium]
MHSHDSDKRRLLKALCCGGIALGTVAAAAGVGAAAGKKTAMTAQQALQALKEGNEKFLNDSLQAPVQSKERRLEIAQGQQPFAVLVSCSDSRVPPELLFGRGLGELFIVRNAGNTVDTVAMGSIQYAVAQLGVPLIVVMGHERCGAVDAALSVVEKNTSFPGSIGQMVEPIVPAVLKAQSSMKGSATRDALLDAAVRHNVMRVVERLRTTEAMLAEPIKAGKLMIVGARYDLDDGRVEFFNA